MDSSEASAQRPVTLDLTMEEASDPPEPVTSQSVSRESSVPRDNDLEDSSATPSENQMDKLNDQMMESVMISDSPHNSEEDDLVPPDSFPDDGVEAKNEETLGDQGKRSETRQKENVQISIEEQEGGFEETTEENLKEHAEVKEQISACASPQLDIQSPSAFGSGEPTRREAKGPSPKNEPVPVCTIFSQGPQTKSLVPDGFQPTLIKSPSFSMGSSGGGSDAVTPGKLTAPLVCQPSPSLSKFFTDNGQGNPASDFFDSFTAPSSFISVSNPNAEMPPGPIPGPVVPTPECQLSSTSPIISTSGGTLDCGAPTPSSGFGLTSSESSSKSLLPQAIPNLAQALTPAINPMAFNQLQAVFSGSDDPFATALSLSEVDRRHDAWLASVETRKVLISMATQQYNPAFVETSRLTMPGLKFDNLQVRKLFTS